MPIYEYQCARCGETTETLQKFSDPPLSNCPACGGKLSKLMSMNSFQLKGSGWYVTDYAGKKDSAAKAPAAGDAPATAAKEAAAPPAKETAPAKKTAKKAKAE
ncbi:MAG: zinc ribbon domain-containing protein [Candidatus Adiutrix sp.]|jgi:putative FmdB family regulatory protein|nr:zinc ribbon domain-containing protein [Candidatus Adiutrix sp.]